jgi:hypothetical protein
MRASSLSAVIDVSVLPRKQPQHDSSKLSTRLASSTGPDGVASSSFLSSASYSSGAEFVMVFLQLPNVAITITSDDAATGWYFDRRPQPVHFLLQGTRAISPQLDDVVAIQFGLAVEGKRILWGKRPSVELRELSDDQGLQGLVR